MSEADRRDPRIDAREIPKVSTNCRNLWKQLEAIGGAGSIVLSRPEATTANKRVTQVRGLGSLQVGCLFQRSNGVWYAAFCLGGKRVWKSMRTKDMSLAESRYEGVARGYVAASSMTITSLAQVLSTEILPGDMRQGTVDIYRQALRTLARIISDKCLRDVTPFDVDRFKAIRLTQVKPSTVHKEFRTLKAAFGRALNYGMISENPFRRTSNVRVTRMRPAYLSRTDFRRLLAVVDDEQMKQIIIVAVHTAMRLGEILNLHVENIDLARGFIHLENRTDFRLKSGRPRSVPIHPEVAKVLRQIGRPSGLAFPDKDGGLLPWRRVSRKFKRYVRKAGLPEDLHWHSTRHTGVTWFVQSGMPLPFVKEIAGHSSISTTMIYAHAAPDELRDSVSRIPGYMTN